MKILTFLIALLIAAPVMAQTTAGWRIGCGASDPDFSGTVKQGDFACFLFETDLLAESPVIQTVGITRLHFNPDILTETPTTAQIWIRMCANKTDSDDEDCPRIHNAVMTGLQGGEGTQLFTERLATGFYKIEIAAEGGAGEFPQVTLWGEHYK